MLRLSSVDWREKYKDCDVWTGAVRIEPDYNQVKSDSYMVCIDTAFSTACGNQIASDRTLYHLI
jgi:hypothetical protein